MKRLLIFLIAILSILLLPIMASADTIYLIDGTTLEGTIIEVTDEYIVIENDTGSFKINKDKVDKVEFEVIQEEEEDMYSEIRDKVKEALMGLSEEGDINLVVVVIIIQDSNDNNNNDDVDNDNNDDVIDNDIDNDNNNDNNDDVIDNDIDNDNNNDDVIDNDVDNDNNNNNNDDVIDNDVDNDNNDDYWNDDDDWNWDDNNDNDNWDNNNNDNWNDDYKEPRPWYDDDFFIGTNYRFGFVLPGYIDFVDFSLIVLEFGIALDDNFFMTYAVGFPTHFDSYDSFGLNTGFSGDFGLMGVINDSKVLRFTIGGELDFMYILPDYYYSYSDYFIFGATFFVGMELRFGCFEIVNDVFLYAPIVPLFGFGIGLRTGIRFYI